MSNTFKIKVRVIDLDWKNTSDAVTDRPQGVNYWQINLFHDPVKIKTANGQLTEVREPSAFFYPPRMPQYYMGLNAGYTDDWCSCDGDMEKALRHHGLTAGEPIPLNNISELERCFRVMYREWNDRPLFSHEALRDLMMEFMRLCARGRLHEVSVEQHYAAILEVRQELREQYQRAWTVPEMAAKLGLSENRFSFLYKRYCGDAPQRDLIAFRMQRAMELIVAQKELSITDIAELCGYSDSMYFSRVFKRFFGRAPSSYKD